MVRKAKCRFLKKDPNSDKYYDIGDEKAREKVAQALREGAAQLRRQRDGESDGSGSNGASSDIHVGENKKCKRAIVEVVEIVNPSIVALEGRDDAEDSPYPPPSVSEEESKQRSIPLTPISIRPNQKLTLKQSCPFANVDDLSPSDRVLYLREFLPPAENSLRYKTQQKIIRVR